LPNKKELGHCLFLVKFLLLGVYMFINTCLFVTRSFKRNFIFG
jgi:hypothetical protein